VIRRLRTAQGSLLGVVLAGLATDALGLDPNRLTTQYVREQWTSEAGFTDGAVNGITQTTDGYLWIGTDKGLLRFDGFDFTPVAFTSIAAASNVPILQLLTDGSGKLWVRPQGTYLVHQEGLEFKAVNLPAITAMAKDRHDGVLISDIEKGTFRFRAGGLQKLGPSPQPAISMSETLDGKVWLGTLGDGLFLLQDGQATNDKVGLPDGKINSLLPIGNELWVGADTGLYHGNGNGFRRLELPASFGTFQALSLLHDRDSNIWVGTTQGLLRINAQGISLSEEKELRGDGGINVLFEDREGNIWIGGGRGFGRIRDSAFVTYASLGDLRFGQMGPVYVDPVGRTWLAPTQGGLQVLQGGHVQRVTSIPLDEVVYSIAGQADAIWVGRQRGGLTSLRFRDGRIASETYTAANGLAQDSVYAVYASRDGSLWAGTLNGGVSKFKDGRFTTFKTTNGLASNTVSSILETRNGAMWFATPVGLSSLSNGQWRTYTTEEGLPSQEVNCLFEDSSGTLWSGTSAGPAFFSSNRFQVPREAPDVLREPIVGMVEDKSKRLWITTSGSVLRVARDKLLGGLVREADIRQYDQADGLASTQGVKRSRSMVADSAGRIWISLRNGLSVVDPSQINDESVPARAHIEAITADNSHANLAAAVRLAASPRRITIAYTGLSLSVPARVRFRYFLEGFDSEWSQPVAAREAVYTNLGAGSYRFRLVASNSEGLWNGPEAVIGFEVAPTIYETWWFRTAIVLCIGLAALAAYLVRMRQMTRLLNARFEERLTERERIARELHDTLLQSVQGLLLKFQTVTDEIPDSTARKRMEDALDRADEVLIEGRDRVKALRVQPTAEADLPQAIETIGEEEARSKPTRFNLSVEGTPRALDPIVRDEVLRIARESLTNAFRHARAGKIEAEIIYDRTELKLRVRDDGCGIEGSILKAGRPDHWGLPGMRERARKIRASFEVWSRPGAGTEVALGIPARFAYARKPPRWAWWSGRLRIEH